MTATKTCKRCGREFQPYGPAAARQVFCKLDPAGDCKELYWKATRRAAAPAGHGRRRPKRFEVGQAVHDLVEELHELGMEGTPQAIVEHALEELVRDRRGWAPPLALVEVDDAA